jgi:hypothetical protein
MHPLLPITTIVVKEKHKGGHGKPPLLPIVTIIAKKNTRGALHPFFFLLQPTLQKKHMEASILPLFLLL